MKIWLDDIRPAPEGYVWCKSVNSAKSVIESAKEPILLIDCDHDLGGIIELVYIVLQSVVKPGITGFFKIDLHIKCYIYLS